MAVLGPTPARKPAATVRDLPLLHREGDLVHGHHRPVRLAQMLYGDDGAHSAVQAIESRPYPRPATQPRRAPIAAGDPIRRAWR